MKSKLSGGSIHVLREVAPMLLLKVVIAAQDSGCGYFPDVNEPNPQQQVRSLMANRRTDDDDLDQALDALDVERNFLDDVETTSGESTGLLLRNDDFKEQQDEKEAGCGGGGCVLLMVVILVVTVIRFLWLPLLLLVLVILLGIIVARTQIPPQESFHIKKEIKRIQRGKHLSADHHQKKKTGWLEKKVNNVTTFLSTEAKDAVGGFDDVQFCDVGFGILVIARDLTTSNAKYYSWLGFLGEWRVLDCLSPETQAKLHRWLWSNRRSDY